jgi:RNA polymerase sigma-70 factor, ECF subfamily
VATDPQSTPDERDRANRAVRTLGHVLYADAAKATVPEREWVELVHAIARRDHGALRELYDRAHHVVFTLALRITGRRETADELTVDVFHDVWRRAAGYDANGGTVMGWIMNQARSRAIDRLRFDQRQKRAGDNAAVPQREHAGVADAMCTAEQAAVLKRAIGGLAPGERAAIEAAFFGGLPYREVAERLAQPLGTVKTRIRSGLAKLRDALQARKDTL